MSLKIPESFEVQASFVDERWKDYGLAEVGIKLRDIETGYKLIVRDGDPIAITSRGYVLIPNPVALKAADDAAKIVGATPFEDFSGPWYCKTADHVMMNAEQTRMVALYAFNDPVEIQPGDKIHMGFSVRNGIDGGAAFGVGMFTFRHACANMFLMKAWRGQGTQTDTLGQIFDDRRVLSWLWKIHYGKETEQLVDPKEIVPVIRDVIESGNLVVEKLRRMAEVKLTEKKADQLIRGIPLKYLEKVSGFAVEKKAGKKSSVDFAGDVSELQVWTDLTDLLTLDAKGGWDTKMQQYQVVQSVLFRK